MHYQIHIFPFQQPSFTASEFNSESEAREACEALKASRDWHERDQVQIVAVDRCIRRGWDTWEFKFGAWCKIADCLSSMPFGGYEV